IAHHVAFGVARVQAEASVETLLTAEQAARREAEGARLDAERKRTIAEELARLARLMTETLDVESVAERIVTAALHLFQAGAAGLRLAPLDGSLRGVAFAGRLKDIFPVGHTVSPGPVSMSGLAMTTGAAVWTDDTLTDPRLRLAPDIREGMRSAGNTAGLAAPLRMARACSAR